MNAILSSNSEGTRTLSEVPPGKVVLPAGCLLVDGKEVDEQPLLLVTGTFGATSGEALDLKNCSPLHKGGKILVFVFEPEFSFQSVGKGTLLKNAKPGQAVKILSKGTDCKDLPYYLICKVTPEKPQEMPLLKLEKPAEKDSNTRPILIEYFDKDSQILAYEVDVALKLELEKK